MIQELGEHKLHNHFEVRTLGPGDFTLAYRDNGVVASLEDGSLRLPLVREWDGLDSGDATFAFKIDDRAFFLLNDESLPLPAGFDVLPIRTMRLLSPRTLAYASVIGYQLRAWYRDNRYCGRCGHATELAPRSREIVCPDCGKIVYPKIQPAVICGVVDGDRILLTKYADRTYKHYSLVAGFTEIGETLEETCHREVMEEVGVEIEDLWYYKDQPWPFSASILSGFFCHLKGDPSIRVDHSELRLGEWTARDDVPDMGRETTSLTGEMIQFFKEHPEAF